MTIHYTCKACAKSYSLKDSYAGKKVTCKCGQKFRLPAGESAGKSCPRCNTLAGENDAICIQCGYDFRHGGSIDASHNRGATTTAGAGEARFRQTRTILAVAAAGIGVFVLFGLWRCRRWRNSIH